MPWKFNPFSGTLDQTGSGGGGASYIDGEVQYFSDLPQTIGSPAVDSAYLVREAEGAWLLARKPAGIYIRTADSGVRADDWTHASAFPDVFSDANFLLYDNGDATKNLQFQLSGLTTGTTRTLTVPNSSGTISLNGHTHIASDIVFGQFANNRINWAEADPIGSSVANTGTFTTLTANTALVVKDGTGNETATFDAQNKLTANRTYDLPDASGTIALLETLPAGGTKTYATFTALDNNPPATAFATIDQRNSTAVLDFDDATDESAVFVSIIPEAASLGSGLKIRLHWMATTATSGNVVWDVSLERMNTDLDADSFSTIASGTAAANGTSGILTVTEITLTTIDSVTAGDGFRLKVTRDANNGSDTMTGDAELVVCEVRSAA